MGIIRILKDYGFSLSIRELLQQAFALYGPRQWKLDQAQAVNKLCDFVGGRLQNYLQGAGYSVVLTEACLHVDMDNVPDVCARLEQLSAFAKSADYVPSVQIMKRIANILQKQQGVPESYKAELFQHESEKNLASQLEKLESLGKSREYGHLLETLVSLRPYVDAFFDSVMVICEDLEVRKNRLALLMRIHNLYSPIADFSALQI